VTANWRPIRAVTRARAIDMDGFAVKQPLPHPGLAHLDPFLLLHHARVEHPGGHRPQEDGVPPHPHRGFEPVTFVFDGAVHHRDSRGNDSVIQAGGVQWTTAGMGLVHSERPTREISEHGGTQEIVQLWINLPKRLKFVQPAYQGVQAGALPAWNGHGVTIRVVAGELEGRTGPVRTHTPVVAATGSFDAGARHDFVLPESHNIFMYLLDGGGLFNGVETVQGERLVAFERAAGAIRVEARAPTRFLLMSGEPINESVVTSGPFVMNDTTEILEAMRDFRMGKMGVLIETF